tara:strand:- start:416 stop:574 length:159 start_codon:yes stop_codon:yes gene_type:complete
MFNKNKILKTPIVMFKIDVVKYHKNKAIFQDALKHRKKLKSLKLLDFKPIEQ